MWLDTEDGSKERIRLGYLYGRVLMKKMADEYLMDKLFKEMLDDESQGLQKCPTCDTIIQRKDGCNKMLCSTCATSFCNLCGVYLEREKPYDHFKDPESSCYGRLFQGMPGLEEPQVEYPELIRNDE